MKKTLKEYLLINLGLFIVAVIIQYFMVPNNFVLGGVSGLAIVIERLVPYLTVGDIMIILNVILFVFGFLLIGRKFGARTIYSSFALSFMVRILDVVYSVDEPLMEDTFAQLIIATLLGAIGLAIVFKNNASTGGTDITAKILNKYFHIDLGKGVLYSDITVALSAFFVFNISTGIYAVLGVVLNGFIIDYILERFKEKKEVVIISEHNEKIKDFIINRLEKGATIYSAKGAYTNKEKDIIRTVVTRKEFIKLKKYIKTLDQNVFITVNNIHETFGLGFLSLDE